METLHLYPTALARDAALEALPDAAWTQAHLTFAEFIEALKRALSADSVRAEVSDCGRLALLAKGAEGNPELARLAESEAGLKSADGLLSSWKSAALRPADLRAASKELTAENRGAARTLELLATWFDAYEKLLGKEFTDHAGVEREFLRQLEGYGRIPLRSLPAGGPVELHGFHRLAYHQFRVVQKLLQQKYEVLIDSPVFDVSSEQTAALRVTFGSGAFHRKPETQRKFSELAQNAQRLEAASSYEEVYEIGRRVAGWIARDKVRPRDICVAFRDVGRYSQAIHDVFKRLGIPFYERRGEPAQFQPIVRVALSAIEACVNGLDRRSVFRFLCAGPVDVSTLAGVSKKLNPHDLHDLALEAGIECDFSGGDPSAYWKARLENSRWSDAGALFSIVSRFAEMRADAPASTLAEKWRGFFHDCGLTSAAISDKLKSSTSDTNETAGLLKEQLALAALEAALDEVSKIPTAKLEKISVGSFLKVLTLALQEQSVSSGGTERGGVRVLNLFDVRGLNFKRLVIGGMAEGICPARAGADALLGLGSESAIRAALAARVNDRDAAAFLSPRLSGEVEAEERALFNGALLTASEQVLLTRPHMDFDGKALAPSEYWNEFFAPVEFAAPIHPAPAMSECLVPEENELRAAWLLGNGAEEDKSTERASALAAFAQSPRLKAIAQRAAVENLRYEYFLNQALAKQKEQGETKTPSAPTLEAGEYNGVLRYSGELTPEQIFNEISSGVTKRLTRTDSSDPSLSPSDFEKLVECPYRFFTERVCGFEQVSEPENEISGLDLGSLWHDILAGFYQPKIEALKSGALTVRLDAARRSAYLKELNSLAEVQIAKTLKGKFTGHPGFWLLQERRVHAVLEKWLDCELRKTADDFFPAFVEFPFGFEKDQPAKGLLLPLPNETGNPDGLRIRGRIDRIDFKTELRGKVETVVGVRVIDYKLGWLRTYSDKVKEEKLEHLLAPQLPLYVAAVMDYLYESSIKGTLAVDMNCIWNDAHAGYFSLRNTAQLGEDELPYLMIQSWPLGSLRSFLNPSALDSDATLFNIARQHLLTAFSGNFAVKPLECKGVYCPSRYMCRYQEMPAAEENE